MNCFEARQEFSGLWRKTVAAGRRAGLIAHLKGCMKCDHAFRLFALTAPVLHSERAPPAPSAAIKAGPGFPMLERPDRFAPVSRTHGAMRQWLAMSAAAMVFVLASSAAYFSVKAPHETLADAFANSDSSVSSETAIDLFEPDLTTTGNDLAS